MFEERVIFFLYGIILCFTLGFAMMVIATHLSDYQMDLEDNAKRIVFTFLSIVGLLLFILIDVHYSILGI